MLATLRAPDYAANLRRLMAREGLTLAQLVERTKLDHRTLKRLLKGRKQPQSRTLHRLAASLNVPVEELFQDAALLRHRLFDRKTNPVVDEVVESHPRLFHGWTEAEFDELYSRFGAGGALTAEGALLAVKAANRRRELLAKVALCAGNQRSRIARVDDRVVAPPRTGEPYGPRTSEGIRPMCPKSRCRR